METDRRHARQLIHEYFGVDLALVWDVVERELPDLRPRLQALLTAVTNDESGNRADTG